MADRPKKVWKGIQKGKFLAWSGAFAQNGTIVLGLVFLALFPVLFKPWIHGFDTVAYYSWLRSAVIDGDLNVGNEFSYYGYGSERGLTVTDHTHNEWAVGSAVLWSPFFLAAHGFSLLGRQLGLPIATDGYATQYVWAISLGSSIYALLGILLMHSVCRELFSPRTSVLATTAIWLASPLVFYMYSHPAMSHANDFFAYSLFVFVWYKTRSLRTWRGAALRGAAAGLCALVRQVNAVFVVFVLGELGVHGVRAWLRTRRVAETGLALLRMASFSVTWWLAYLPQVIVWRVAFGHWIELNPYAAGAGVGFRWLQPQVLAVLFSPNRGLFVWTPLILLAVLGWILLWRRERRLTLFLALNFGLLLYVVSSWGTWSGSAAFGQRFFTNMVPAFALGLAALLDRLSKHVRFYWLVSACALFVVWNGLLVVRYVVGDVPRLGPVPVSELVVGQFTVIPRYLKRILQILLTRE